MVIQLKGRRRGFTLTEFMVIIAVLAIVAVLLLPALAKSRARPSKINCVFNLKHVGLSFKQWALDNEDKFPDQISVTNGGAMELIESGDAYIHFLVMSNELNSPKVLVCPNDASRLPTTNWSSLRNTNISYFAALDATDTRPQMFLSGDDNFTVVGMKQKRGLLELWTNNPVAWMASRHGYGGNIGLADGSVQAFNNTRLNQALRETGQATNRLMMP